MSEIGGGLRLGQAAAPAEDITPVRRGSLPGGLGRGERAPVSRIVIVLGREPVLDMAPLIKQAWRESAHLVILNLGLPLTPRQQRMSDAALEAAGRGSIGLDELVVFEAHQVAKLIREADQIVLAASRRERKRINTALRQRRLGGSSHPKQRPQPSQPGRASPDS